MHVLMRLLGLPHEALHLVALILIGRRAVRFTLTYVDIPNDLTTRQYVFVAGLPAFVFVLLLVLGIIGLVNAHTSGQVALGLTAVLFGGISAVGTTGDLALVLSRLEQHVRKP
jgi:uncharacterized membrane protein SpoIIM required for sporulation